MKVMNHLAILRNLRNIDDASVSPAHREKLRRAFSHESWSRAKLLPLNFIAAAKHAPRWEREIEVAMLSSLSGFSKIPGHTILVVDVSGSMGSKISAKSEFTRMDAAAAMAMLAAEMCERISVYATAGNDHTRVHKTEFVKPRRGFALTESILKTKGHLGGGGIFTRQCLEYIRKEEKTVPDRIMIFSDSQDCDHANARTPAPFGKKNYIIDVSSERHGINYDGLWTAEITGWSEHFMKFVAALEGLDVTGDESTQQVA